MKYRCVKCQKPVENFATVLCDTCLEDRDFCVAAMQHAETQLTDLNNDWPKNELHEPLAVTLERLRGALGRLAGRCSCDKVRGYCPQHDGPFVDHGFGA